MPSLRRGTLRTGGSRNATWKWIVWLAITGTILPAGCATMTPTDEVVHIEGPSLIGDDSALYKQALHAYRKGDTDRAIAKLEQALRRHPDNGAAHNNLGLLYYGRRELLNAARHFDLASQLRPDDATPLNNLGMTLEAGGRIDEAIEFYEHAVSIDPENPLYLGNLLRARIRLGESGFEIVQELKLLAFIETRPAWVDWVDEQLAIHLNPALDRGPSSDSVFNGSRSRTRSGQPRPDEYNRRADEVYEPAAEEGYGDATIISPQEFMDGLELLPSDSGTVLQERLPYESLPVPEPM